MIKQTHKIVPGVPQIKGRVLIDIVESETGEVVRHFEKDNLVVNQTFVDAYLGGFLGAVFNNSSVFISSADFIPLYSTSSVSNVLGLATRTAKTYYTQYQPNYLEIATEMGIPGVSRDFKMVGLSNNNGNTSTVVYTPPQTFTGGNIRTLVNLGTTLTQGASQVLRIFYHVQFYYGAFKIARTNEVAMCHALAGLTYILSGFSLHTISPNMFPAPATLYSRSIFSNFNNTWRWFNDAATPGGSITRGVAASNTYFRYTIDMTFDRLNTNTLGIIFQGAYYGECSEPVTGGGTVWHSYGPATNNLSYATQPFQKGFWQLSGSNIPFFDAASAGSSEGIITFTGTWDKYIPRQYRIRIVTGGPVGTATYYLQSKPFIGFRENTYTTPSSVDIPYIQSRERPASDVYGWKMDGSAHWLKLSEHELVAYDNTGITIWNIWEGSHQSWGKDGGLTTINWENIRQVAVNPTTRTLYVADTVLGIYKIVIDTNTITNPITQPAYGIDVGRAGSGHVWAIVGGTVSALVSEADNWGTPYTISHTGLTNSLWQNCRYIITDKVNATEDRLVIGVAEGANTRIVWWRRDSNLTQASTLISWNHVEAVGHAYFHDLWVTCQGAPGTGSPGGLVVRMTFGQEAVTTMANTAAGSQFGANAGRWSDNTSRVQMAPLAGRYIPRNDTQLVDVLTDTVAITRAGYNFKEKFNDWSGFNDNQVVIPLTDFVCFIRRYHIESAVLYDFAKSRDLGVTNWGWDGTNWVAGSTTPKVSSGSDEAIIHGLSIRFENGANANLSFIANEYLNRYVCYGVLKDNATNVRQLYFFYAKQLVEATHTENVPGSSPYTITLGAAAAAGGNFIAVDVETWYLGTWTIAGAPLTSFTANGSAPPIGGIDVSPAGVVTFNPGDAGKEFSASPYYYLQH